MLTWSISNLAHVQHFADTIADWGSTGQKGLVTLS